MKLVTLLTTFIITLVSSNVFAQTFVCENWIFNFKELQGAILVSKKDGDTLIIRNDNKRTLTYFRTEIDKPRNLAKSFTVE